MFNTSGYHSIPEPEEGQSSSLEQQQQGGGGGNSSVERPRISFLYKKIQISFRQILGIAAILAVVLTLLVIRSHYSSADSQDTANYESSRYFSAQEEEDYTSMIFPCRTSCPSDTMCSSLTTSHGHFCCEWTSNSQLEKFKTCSITVNHDDRSCYCTGNLVDYSTIARQIKEKSENYRLRSVGRSTESLSTSSGPNWDGDASKSAGPYLNGGGGGGGTGGGGASGGIVFSNSESGGSGAAKGAAAGVSGVPGHGSDGGHPTADRSGEKRMSVSPPPEGVEKWPQQPSHPKTMEDPWDPQQGQHPGPYDGDLPDYSFPT